MASIICVGNCIFRNDALQTVMIDGGYINAADGSYHFYVTDHLGNVRAVTNASGTIEKTFDYYPFGESYESVASTNPGQDFRYGGKQMEDKFGNREVYDFSARWYSPVFGRFQTMDPLCEKYYSLSPYAYCANNPMNNTDVTGCLIDDYLFNQSGKFLGVDETEHEDRIVIKDERGENVLSIMFADTEHDPPSINSGTKLVFVSNKEIEKLLSNAGAMSISHQGLIQGIRYLWNESNNSLLRDLKLTSTTIIMIALIKVPQIPKMTNFQ